jgi:hypothetical protein
VQSRSDISLRLAGEAGHAPEYSLQWRRKTMKFAAIEGID